MRLFGKVDSAINKYDRANWQTGGPWWGFDLAGGAPSVPVVLIGTFDSSLVLLGTADGSQVLAGIVDSSLVLTGSYDAD